MNPDGDLIRLFYQLWEDALPGVELIVSSNSPESLEKLPRSDAPDLNRALRCLNRIGHLVAEGPLEPRFVSTLIGKEVIRTVAKVKPLIEEARTRRSDPQYLEYIDRLFEVCKSAYPDYEPQYFPADERRGMGLRI